MTVVFSVNEISLPSFMAACLRGKRPYVLATDPITTVGRRILQRCVDWAINTGRAQDAAELCPEHRHIRDSFIDVSLYNVFGHIESWQNEYFHFDAADDNLGAYSYAYKNLTCNHLRQRHPDMLFLSTLLTGPHRNNVTVVGVRQCVLEAAQAYASRSFERPVRTVSSGWFAVINMLSAFGIICVSLGWVLVKTRANKIKQQHYFLAADYISDRRDHRLYEALSSGGPLLLVIRMMDKSDPSVKDLVASHDHCHERSGLLNVVGLIETSRFIIKDAWRICSKYALLDPPLFRQLLLLPWRRAILRAFFTRYRPKYYWGRDEYNVQHILRRAELDRIGGISLGIMHGIAAEKNLVSAWRYTNFDIYYVFGKAMQRLYRGSWPADMKVRAVGSFSATQDDYQSVNMDRPKDILIMAGIFTFMPSYVEFIRTVARAFPDRKIWLQVKSGFLDKPRGRTFVAACQKDLPNIIHTTDSVMTLFRRAKYAFSDPSTVVIEALQFGVAAFMADISPIHDECIYREYPGLCVDSAAEGIARIQQIEETTWVYPRESFAELIDLSGRPFCDVVRADVGLA